MNEKKHRLVTRSDMDGLVCAVLLRHLGIIDDIAFVHPKDMQDAKVIIHANDITTNLPFVEGVYLAFDHHLSEALRNEKKDNHIIIPTAPSAARVVFEHFGGFDIFPRSFEQMMIAVDKADSAQFEMSDILEPKGWEFLSFLMDARTGLGRFREFRISNYQLMMDLIDYCRNHTIEEIFELEDVKERVELYNRYANQAKEQILQATTVHNNVAVFDTRNEELIYPTNRFMIYALFPQTNISIHIIWGLKRQNTVLACGKSIFDRSSKTVVGTLMLKYGGGGHGAAGTCQVKNDKMQEVLSELIKQMNEDG